ncbi:MAG: hypothetical protein ABIW30_02710, partial [Arenimonas sp.]
DLGVMSDLPAAAEKPVVPAAAALPPATLPAASETVPESAPIIAPAELPPAAKPTETTVPVPVKDSKGG